MIRNEVNTKTLLDFKLLSIFAIVLAFACERVVAQEPVTFEQVREGIIKARTSVKKLFVDYSAERSADESLSKSHVLEHLGKGERHKFAFDGVKRYSDFVGTGFRANFRVDKFVAVFDGQTMFKRENKFVEITSYKSSSVELNTYLNVLLWPIADADFMLCSKESPSVVPFLPRMLDAEWTINPVAINILDEPCIELTEADSGRTLYLSPSKEFAVVRYSFPDGATGKGLGKFFCECSEFKKYGDCYFPHKVTTRLEVYELNSKSLAGMITNELRVHELKVNDSVPSGLFEFAPLPGDLVIKSDEGSVQTWSPHNNGDIIENSLVEAKSVFARATRFRLLGSVQLRFGIIAFLAGLVVVPVFRFVKKPSKFSSLPFFLVASCYCNTGFAQAEDDAADLEEKYSSYVKTDHHCFLSLRNDASLAIVLVPCRRYESPLPFIEIIARDDVAAELEILDHQLHELREVKARLQSAIEDSERILNESVLRDEKVKSRVVHLLEAPMKSGFGAVDEILVPFQAEALKRVFMTFQIRRIGLCAALTNDPLRSMLGVTDAQVATLQKVQKDNIEVALSKLEELKAAAIDDLLGKLTNEQRTMLTGMLGDEATLARSPFTVFVSQMDPQLLKESVELGEENPWPEYLPLVFSRDFEIGFDSRVRIGSQAAGSTHLIEIPDQLLELLLDPDVQSELVVTQDQLMEIEGVSQSRQVFFTKRLEANNAHLRTNGTAGLDKLHKEWRENWKELALQNMRRLDLALLPFQREQIRRLVDRIGCQRIGLVYSLTVGRPGVDLGLTESKKREISDEGAKLVESLPRKALEIEKELNRKLLDTLTLAQQNELKTLTSEHIGFETGQLDLYKQFQRTDVVRVFVREQQRMLLFASLAIGDGN